jgi:transposase
LSSLVQESLGRDPFAGDGGRSGSLIKALWHEGIGLSLYAKRLDHGRFVCPVTVGGVVGLTAAQAEMSYLLEAIDWRNPQHTGGHRARDNVKKCLEVRRKDASNRLFCDSIGPWVTAIKRLKPCSRTTS